MRYEFTPLGCRVLKPLDRPCSEFRVGYFEVYTGPMVLCANCGWSHDGHFKEMEEKDSKQEKDEVG